VPPPLLLTGTVGIACPEPQPASMAIAVARKSENQDFEIFWPKKC
jgi:hypothetical protein